MSSMVLSGDTSGTVTLTVPAVAGTNTITLPAATGTVQVSGNQPAFRAYLTSGNQTISSATITKVQFNAETFDTANCFDSTTNYRFTPNVAGYYQFNACIEFQGFAVAGGCGTLYLYKNGAGTSYAFTFSADGSSYPSVCLSDILYANGTTDYFEVYFLQNSGSNKLLYAGTAPVYTFFSGCLVRTA